MGDPAITVRDGDHELRFGYGEMMRYHGGGSPGGVAVAFKLLERGLPLLDGGALVQRRGLRVTTAFGGPGARDALELVTRAVTERRLVLDPGLARPALGPARERFVFRLVYQGAELLLVLRDGFVTDQFIRLTRTPDRTAEQERALDRMKAQLASRVMAAPAADVFDVE